MLKLTLTALATAVLCFGGMAAAGFARGGAHSYTLAVGDRAVFPALNFQCQAVSKNQAACGAATITNSTQVYYYAKQLAVVKFGKTLSKGTIILQVKR